MTKSTETVSREILSARTSIGALRELIPHKDSDKIALIDQADEALKRASSAIQSLRLGARHGPQA